MADHLVARGAGPWRFWRSVCLRGTGFPARLVLRLGDADAARAADAVRDAEHDATNAREQVFAALREASSRVVVGATDEASATLRAALTKARKRVAKGHLPETPTGTGEAVDRSVAAAREAVARLAAAQASFAAAFCAGRERNSATLREIASDPLFREAVTWQNRGVVKRALDGLLTRPAGRSSNEDRRNEDLVANYLQRYCTKNDTIGFFGPWGWAEIGEQDRALDVAPGRRLLRRRGVYFEQWPIDALAKGIAKEEGILAWTPPRRVAFVRVHESVAFSPTTGERRLSRAEELALGACDGERLPAEITAALVGAHPDVFELETDVEDALHALVAAELVTWSFSVPLCFEPDLALRRRIDRIGDEALRARALAPLARLDADRRAVAEAAGDAVALDAATARLEETFTSLTGLPPSLHAGHTYGGRGIVFEDTVRDVEVTFGSAVLEAIEGPLGLVLTSARWLTYTTARVYREALIAIHRELAAGDGGVPFVDLWLRAQRLFGGKARPVDGVVAELEERWSKILHADGTQRRVSFTTAELTAAVDEAFAAPGPGWAAARHHSPDLMIAAESAEAVRAGRFELVLGEIHLALPTVASATCAHHHPAPEALASWIAQDIPEPRYLTVSSKASPGALVRILTEIAGPRDHWLETGVDEANGPRARVLESGDLTVYVESGSIFVRADEGRGDRIDLIELLAQELSNLVAQRFGLRLRAQRHVPRLTIDRLVVGRETWRFAPSEVAFLLESDPQERFAAARRWASTLELPRFVFVKTQVEMKPFYVDFESPVLVETLAKMIRRAKDHVTGESLVTLSEMLPGLDQLWLTDAAGEPYACELRCTVVDERSPAAHE